MSWVEKVLDRKDENSIYAHLDTLYSLNKKLLHVGVNHIIILWDEASDDKQAQSVDVMTDVWLFDKIDSWGSGPLVDVKIFRNMQEVTNIGTTTGDGLIMLGREEELRRTSSSLENYLNGVRPVLPKDIQPTEEFYL